MENLSEEEVELVSQLRQRVNSVWEEPSDQELIPWIRARDHDLNKSEEMLRKSLVWRRNNEVEDLILWKSPRVYFRYIHSGYDVNGVPVVIFPIGHWDLKATVEVGDLVPSLKFIFQVLEVMVAAGKKRRIRHGIFILDFEGFYYSQITHRTVVQGIIEVVRSFEANYPEILNSAYVINAPKIFNLFLAIIKPFLNSKTLSKLKIYGPDPAKWKAALLNNIPSDQLPPYWGGTKKGTDEFCSSDWFQEPLPPLFLKTSGCFFDHFNEEWFIIKIPAREKYILEYPTKDKDVITWNFTSDTYNIVFGVLKEVNGFKSVVLNEAQVDSHLKPQSGSLCLSSECNKVILIFDNSFSRQRGKTVNYCVTVK